MLDTSRWNKLRNCWAYAMNDSLHTKWSEQQPGWHSGLAQYRSISRGEYNCADMVARVRADNVRYEPWDCEQPCPASKRKVFLSVDPGVDYHFYRDFSSEGQSLWCHKPGPAPPRCLPVGTVPWHHPRRHGRFHYRDACGCFCV